MHMHSITWMYACRHNYTQRKRKRSVWNDTPFLTWTHTACVQIHWSTEISCQRFDAVDRIDCRWYRSSWMLRGTFFLPPTETPFFFPFMLLVTWLLFRLQSLIGGRHTLKCFPHACRIFIQMCERGQGEQLVAAAFCVFHPWWSLGVQTACWLSRKEEHVETASQQTFENANRQGKQMTFTNAENVN